MLFGRFASIVLVLGLAGSLARKQHVPASAGTFPTTSPLFVGLLSGVIVIVTALTYFPALVAGPDRGRTVLDVRRRMLLRVRSRTRSASSIPRRMWRNPVMFVVEIGSVLTTLLFAARPVGCSPRLIAVWLWLTVRVREPRRGGGRGPREGAGRGAAGHAHQTTVARRLRADGTEEPVPGTELRPGDRCVVEAGEVIPGDGEVVEGVASVDESRDHR